jgi:hypothetical protein
MEQLERCAEKTLATVRDAATSALAAAPLNRQVALVTALAVWRARAAWAWQFTSCRMLAQLLSRRVHARELRGALGCWMRVTKAQHAIGMHAGESRAAIGRGVRGRRAGDEALMLPPGQTPPPPGQTPPPLEATASPLVWGAVGSEAAGGE